MYEALAGRVPKRLTNGVDIMGKVLRVLVVLGLPVALAAVVFAYLNHSKREALVGRNQLLEDYVIRMAGTFEAVDLQDKPTPEYPEKDMSEVTSRELENPERSDFWGSYKAKLEAEGDAPAMLNLGTQDKRLQLRKLYQTDEFGKKVIDPITGGPATNGEGTMDELLSGCFDRAKAQYNMLVETRGELIRIRSEYVDTVEEFNKLKQSGRSDKRQIEVLNGEVSSLNGKLRETENKLAVSEENLKEAQGQIDELNDTVDGLNEEISVCNEKIAELEQSIRDLKGRNTSIIPAATAPVEEGGLSPGDKGSVVACNEEYKYVIVKFSPEFMTELIGANRDRGLPQCEVMVRRAGEADIDKAFVTRLKLRQVIRDKDLVIADIMVDWQQKPLNIGDVVYY